ncbi:MAG: sensor hybrid histidine kinase, partial [Geminicoccaceae bacterium]|nr:sensor hybrid histidine kinase [Geminicoccaceae bacterium]
LRESEERYRDLFDNASDLVCMAAPDGSLLYVNQAWKTGTGYGEEEIGRMQLLDLVHPDCRARYAEVLERVLQGDRLDHVELVLVPKNGTPITVEGNLSCTFKDGQSSVIRGIYRDVTERKRVEEHLRRAERMQAAGKLAGGVAHEVNNMMTGVIGFSEFLLRSLEEGDGRRADVEEIIKAGTRAADVTRQLLAFTRQQFLQPQVLDVNTVVSDMEKMLRRSLGEGHVLTLRLSSEAGKLRADRGQLEQVLINLVINARDAMTSHGRVTIETAAAVWDEVYAQRHGGVDLPLGNYVMLAVSDTGCGMEPEIQERIFEPFFTTKPIGQGTGLGLSTVYGIVKQSGGYVWVYSEPGEGSVFKIYLPAAAPSGPDEIRAQSLEVPVKGTERILVIEDEDIVRNLACRGLKDHGYSVVEARNGIQALRYMRDHPGSIDLVITDVVMPEMGGRELAEQYCSCRATPVMMLSTAVFWTLRPRSSRSRSPPSDWPPRSDPCSTSIRVAEPRPGSRFDCLSSLRPGVHRGRAKLQVVGSDCRESLRRGQPSQPLPRHIHHPLGYAGENRNHLIPGGGIQVHVSPLVLLSHARLHTGHLLSSPCHRLARDDYMTRG